MYQVSYAEVLDDAPKQNRDRERRAIERSIDLLRAAEPTGTGSRESAEALLFVRQLWTVFVEDLAQPDNDLPQKLRADLISIGLWVMREIENIRMEKTPSFKDLIEVSQLIAEGLK